MGINLDSVFVHDKRRTLGQSFRSSCDTIWVSVVLSRCYTVDGTSFWYWVLQHRELSSLGNELRDWKHERKEDFWSHVWGEMRWKLVPAAVDSTAPHIRHKMLSFAPVCTLFYGVENSAIILKFLSRRWSSSSILWACLLHLIGCPVQKVSMYYGMQSICAKHS